MAIILKRQLSDSEKEMVLQQHGRICFANGHPIPEGDSVHFDHIHAYSRGGESTPNNIAPMCATHNKEKGQLPLADFRVKLQLHEFFESGDRLTLKNLLQYFKSKGDIQDFGMSLSTSDFDSEIELTTPNKKEKFPLFICPATKWKYFYATLDVSMIDSDDDEDQKIGLQPRYLIFDKVFELYRHFQIHPVLQPSIGRIFNNSIRIFDGQHKIAALLWNDRKKFECKIYLQPDIRLLNQTNISAHDKFAQTRFYSSIMVLKLGSQFGIDFENYKNLEDGQPKTEAGFMDYLSNLDGGSLTKGQLNERFRSYLYNSILESEECLFKKYITTGNRSTGEKPITLDMLTKSVFSGFLYRVPTNDNLASDSYRRDTEMNNMIRLINLFVSKGLYEWDPKAGSHSTTQRRLDRIFRSKSMMAWSELLRDSICGKLELNDADAREMPFYRDLSEDDWEKIELVVSRLMTWKRWESPFDDEIDRILSDNKSAVKDWLRNHGLETGFLMGAPA